MEGVSCWNQSTSATSFLLIAEGVCLQCLSVWNRLKDCRCHTLILPNAAERCFTLPQRLHTVGCMYQRGSRTISASRCFHIRAGRGREPISSLPAFVRKSAGAPYVCSDIISQSAALQPNTAEQRQCEWEVKTHMVVDNLISNLISQAECQHFWVSWTGQHVELLLILAVCPMSIQSRHFRKAAESACEITGKRSCCPIINSEQQTSHLVFYQIKFHKWLNR